MKKIHGLFIVLFSFVFTACPGAGPQHFVERLNSMNAQQIEEWLAGLSEKTVADANSIETSKTAETFKRGGTRTDVLGIVVLDQGIQSALDKKGITLKLRTAKDVTQLLAIHNKKTYAIKLSPDESISVDKEQMQNKLMQENPMANDFAFRSEVSGKVYTSEKLPDLYFLFTHTQIVGGCDAYSCRHERKMQVLTGEEVFKSPLLNSIKSPTYQRSLKDY